MAIPVNVNINNIAKPSKPLQVFRKDATEGRGVADCDFMPCHTSNPFCCASFSYRSPIVLGCVTNPLALKYGNNTAESNSFALATRRLNMLSGSFTLS